jgi:phage-related protein
LHGYAGIDIVCVVKKSSTPTGIKSLEFLGSSRDDLRSMPDAVRHEIGFELMRVQFGGEPTNFKPMSAVGATDCEGRYRAG